VSTSSAPEPEPAAAAARAAAPRELRWAAAVVLGQGAALVGGGVVFAARTVMSPPPTLSNAIAVISVTVGVGVLLGWLARGLVRLRLWARTPVVLLEGVSLPVGVTLMQAHRQVAGVPVLLLAATVLYLLFTPSARVALER
jgi:hypothetical protein